MKSDQKFRRHYKTLAYLISNFKGVVHQIVSPISNSESTNFYRIFIMISFSTGNQGTKNPFWTNNIFFSTAQAEKNSGKKLVKKKLVKTSDEFVKSRVRSEQEENAFLAYKSLPELDQRLYQLHSNLKSIIVFEAPTLHFPENNQILGMYEV